MVEQLVPIPIVAGLVEIIKTAGLPSRYAPIVSLLVGIGVSYLFGWSEWQWGILNGVVYGLSASGLYSGVKAVATGE